MKKTSDLRSDAQGTAFLENRREAGNLARSRLSGGSWVISEPSCSAESWLKAGCSQDWLPHKAARIFIIRCDAAGVMSNLCHLAWRYPSNALRTCPAAHARSSSEMISGGARRITKS